MRSNVRPLRSFLTVLSLVGGLGCMGDVDTVSETDLALADPPMYLALGDSIAFGYDPTILPPDTPNWFEGYPKRVAEAIDIPHINASCPGETSGSFIDPTAADNGCRDFKAGFGLHVDYEGTQLAFAADHLATHSRVELVSVAVGANDILLLLYSCGGDTACAMAGLPAVLEQVGGNMATILGTIRGLGYTGQIVVPLYYARDYRDPVEVGAIYYLNETLRAVAAPFGAEVADNFGAFAYASAPTGGSPCAAGLLIPLPGGGCDQHPSDAGDAILAGTLSALVPPRE